MPQRHEINPTTDEALKAGLFAALMLHPRLQVVPDANGGLTINTPGYAEASLHIDEFGKAEFHRWKDGVLIDRRECQIPYPEWYIDGERQKTLEKTI